MGREELKSAIKKEILLNGTRSILSIGADALKEIRDNIVSQQGDVESVKRFHEEYTAWAEFAKKGRLS